MEFRGSLWISDVHFFSLISYNILILNSIDTKENYVKPYTELIK
jgi:hypothetical protein